MKNLKDSQETSTAATSAQAQQKTDADSATHETAKATASKKASMADILHDKQHKELVFYLSVAIFFVELIVGGVAFFYGIIHAEPGPHGGPPQFQFPWLAYGIAAVVAPAALLLIVHMAGVGLFRSIQKKTPEEEEAWRQNLPRRLQKVYAIIQGAPTIVLFLGVMFMGVALFYVDGAITLVMRFGEALLPFWPWIIGGLLGAICIMSLGKGYFTYRTRRMEHEYAFRREIFERTGHILVDKGVTPLSLSAGAYDADAGPTQAMISGKIHDTEALPSPSPSSSDVTVVTSTNHDAEQKNEQNSEHKQNTGDVKNMQDSAEYVEQKETVQPTER